MIDIQTNSTESLVFQPHRIVRSGPELSSSAASWGTVDPALLKRMIEEVLPRLQEDWIVAQYRELADEERCMANAGMADYAALVAGNESE